MNSNTDTNSNTHTNSNTEEEELTGPRARRVSAQGETYRGSGGQARSHCLSVAAGMFCRRGGDQAGSRGPRRGIGVFMPRILEGYLENGARRNRAGWVGAELGGGVVAGR